MIYINDRFGNPARALDLSSGIVQIPKNAFRFRRDSSFTVSLWFTHRATGNARLISTESPEGLFRISNWGGNGVFAVQFGSYLIDTLSEPWAWNHLVFVYHAGRKLLYLNGVLRQDVVDNTPDEPFEYSNDLTIGAKASNPRLDRWSGAFDDLGIWNRALDPEEVADLYAASRVKCSEFVPLYSGVIRTNVPYTWQSKPLLKGVPYRIIVNGTWTFNGGVTNADWEYQYEEQAGSCFPQAMSGPGIGRDSLLLELGQGRINNNRLPINCEEHLYQYDIIGDGRPLYVMFRDNPYTDNRGLLIFNVLGCADCTLNIPADSILGYRSVETHEVVTYALRNNPNMTYQWTATGGYLLGETNKHFCDVIWGYDNAGSVCCIVSDTTCSDTICVTTSIQPKRVVSVPGDGRDVPSMTVRPNPASETIEIVAAPSTGAAGFELVTATGNVVYQASGAAARMDVSDIPVGVYHIVQRNAYGEMIGMQRVVIVR